MRLIPTPGISAAALIDMMARLRPQHAAMLSQLGSAIASGSMDLHSFCTYVRASIGGTVLFDALLALQGVADATSGMPSSAQALCEHCLDCAHANGSAHGCAPQCNVRGCAAVAHMKTTMRAHFETCAAPGECKTCDSWCRLRSLERSLARTRPAPIAASVPLMRCTDGGAPTRAQALQPAHIALGCSPCALSGAASMSAHYLQPMPSHGHAPAPPALQPLAAPPMAAARALPPLAPAHPALCALRVRGAVPLATAAAPMATAAAPMATAAAPMATAEAPMATAAAPIATAAAPIAVPLAPMLRSAPSVAPAPASAVATAPVMAVAAAPPMAPPTPARVVAAMHAPAAAPVPARVVSKALMASAASSAAPAQAVAAPMAAAAAAAVAVAVAAVAAAAAAAAPVASPAVARGAMGTMAAVRASVAPTAAQCQTPTNPSPPLRAVPHEPLARHQTPARKRAIVALSAPPETIEAAPRVAAAVVAPPGASSAAGMLMLLACSALGEIACNSTNSPLASPCGSPRESPLRQRKRPKAADAEIAQPVAPAAAPFAWGSHSRYGYSHGVSYETRA